MLARLILVSALVPVLALPAYGQEAQVKWEKTFAAAMEKAGQTGKPAFVDFTSEIN